MKKIIMLFAVLCSTLSIAELAEVGKPFPSYTLQDQFGETNTFQSETRFVIIASEKNISGKVNDWLKPKEQGYLAKLKTEYVSDIEPMPGIITTLFAMPKMKKYPFKLLLATDKSFAQTYPSQKDRIALFILDDKQVIREIRYVETAEEIETLLTAGQ